MKAADGIELEEAACPLGCLSGDEVVLVGRDRIHGLPGEFPVVRCRSCGLMRTNPRPSPDSMSFYYPDDYGPYVGTKVEEGARTAGSPWWKRAVKRIIQFNTNRIPAIEPGRLLEIGCASGGFMDRMVTEGWEADGIEFSESASAAARQLGYAVHAGALESAPEKDAVYDMVVGWMVMEHLHEPLAALKKLHRWTKPGGWLVVSIPNAAALEFRIFKEAWYALHLPNHLFHYTPESFGKLLHEGGWRIEKVFHQRVLTNLVAGIGYRIQDRWPKSRLGEQLARFPERGVTANIMLYPLAVLMAAIGQTGRMTIWARRV